MAFLETDKKRVFYVWYQDITLRPITNTAVIDSPQGKRPLLYVMEVIFLVIWISLG